MPKLDSTQLLKNTSIKSMLIASCKQMQFVTLEPQWNLKKVIQTKNQAIKKELLIDITAIIDLKLQLKWSAFRFTFFFK